MKNKETLKVLGQVYSWMGLAVSIVSMFDSTDNIGLALKMVLMLAFLYEKINWRMLVMVLSAYTVLWNLLYPENILSLIDIAGFSVIFWYALKYRK